MQSSPEQESVELPYRVVSEPEWNAAAAATASVGVHPSEELAEVVVVSGPCPRCEHPTVFSERLVAYSDMLGAGSGRRGLLARALRRAAARGGRRDIEVICSCGGAHPDAGEESGCGASWVLTVEWGQ
ncbi:hypothetical protein AB0933_20150 [Streptomyces venezuelae]|uniref:hypothetical protein n=1 Tax=Streptomyces venezuelae TaxID=54571 RepID=UPI0034569FC3